MRISVGCGHPALQKCSTIFYKKNFTRVLQKHDDSAELYRKNHPGFRLIYFIMDESSGYICTTDIIENEMFLSSIFKLIGAYRFFFAVNGGSLLTMAVYSAII